MNDIIPQKPTIAVLTSGGDAAGMNAAVRAVVRAALNRGSNVYAIYEGYYGMVNGGNYIRPMAWEDVGGILQLGGTVIGTARCAEFRTRDGRRQAAFNLVKAGIDRLIVIGGDGSLTGANLFREEWASLLDELVERGEISSDDRAAHPVLYIAGLVGSIDNDMFGTDMTIGADTALHRIIEAIDAINSTAASHQRTFVVEVMGRHCGYLALMSAVAAGANWVFIPESPPEQDNWEDNMCRSLRGSKEIGRRNTIVVVAEGAQDRHGKHISSHYIKEVIETRLGADTRVTILGHVQRGGAPTGFERYMATVLGYEAVDEILSADSGRVPQLIGLREHNVVRSPLMECVTQTHRVAEVISRQDYATAMQMRGGSFAEAFRIFRTLTRAQPHEPAPGQKRLNIAVMHIGAPAPGMNTAVRVAVRLGLDAGHIMLGVHNGIRGLLTGLIEPLDWMDVSGWMSKGGADLGTSRHRPRPAEMAQLAAQIEKHQIDAILVIGGWAGYESTYRLAQARREYPAFNIPIVCLPTSINNNLPGSEHSVGADTALNNIVSDVDKIKQTAVASGRCFIVETMGRDCGYLALMSGFATGAERVYLPEEGISLAGLQEDVNTTRESFENGKRLGLFIRNENADQFYTADFMQKLFEKEGGELFRVRTAILGHVQQGGNPSPYDRIQASRLAARCIDFLMEHGEKSEPDAEAPIAAVGLQHGRVAFTDLMKWPTLIDEPHQRPRHQWWMRLRPIAASLATYNPPA